MSSEAIVQQGWTPEELQAFGVVGEGKPEEKINQPDMSQQELLKLQQQFNAEQQRQTSLLQQEVMRQRLPQPVPQTAQNPLEKLPDKLKIQVGDDGQLWLDPKDVANVSQRTIDSYHQNVIAPAAPILANVERSQNLQNTIQWLQKEDAKLLEGKNPEMVASLAAGLYESPLNPGQDDLSKSNYVLDNLRQMNLQPGNPSIRASQPTNQVGRTAPGGASNQLPFARGEKINLPRTTPQEMGLDAFNASVDQERYLRDVNEQHKMGWTFNIHRPR